MLSKVDVTWTDYMKAHRPPQDVTDLMDATSRRPTFDPTPDLAESKPPRPCSELGAENDKRRRDSFPVKRDADSDGLCG